MMLTQSSVESDAQWSKEMREEIALPLFFRHVASRFLRQAKTKGVEVKLVSLFAHTFSWTRRCPVAVGLLICLTLPMGIEKKKIHTRSLALVFPFSVSFLIRCIPLLLRLWAREKRFSEDNCQVFSFLSLPTVRRKKKDVKSTFCVFSLPLVSQFFLSIRG